MALQIAVLLIPLFEAWTSSSVASFRELQKKPHVVEHLSGSFMR